MVYDCSTCPKILVLVDANTSVHILRDVYGGAGKCSVWLSIFIGSSWGFRTKVQVLCRSLSICGLKTSFNSDQKHPHHRRRCQSCSLPPIRTLRGGGQHEGPREKGAGEKHKINNKTKLTFRVSRPASCKYSRTSRFTQIDAVTV
jgi:hypothetical protein